MGAGMPAARNAKPSSAQETASQAAPPANAGTRPMRALIVFNQVENAGLAGRGAIDMDGYPKLWHDFQPDASDGRGRDADGKVIFRRG